MTRGPNGQVRGQPRCAARIQLALAGAAIEIALFAGIVLPLRLDRHPPSLATNLAGVYGLDLAGMLLYAALAGVLLAAYVIAARTTAALPRSAAAVIGATAIFGATLLPAHPTYSSDLFHYVATARVDFAHHANPHTTSPETFADDPLMQLSGWKWVPSPYGPGWSLLSALPYVASGGAATATRSVLAFKALSVLCLVGATAGVARAAERLRPGSGARAAVLFGWSPLVLIHGAADGHNDAAMLCALAWALVAFATGHRSSALVLATAACLIKPAAGFAALALLIVLLHHREWRTVTRGLGVAALLAVALTARYWDGVETARAMLDEGRYFANTPASLLQRMLEPSIGGDPARLLIGVIAHVLLLTALVWLAWRSDGTAHGLIVTLAMIYLLAVIPLATWYQPWYATWPLLFIAVAAGGDRRWSAIAAAIALGGLLIPVSVNFIAAISGLGARNGWIDALSVTFVVVPVLMIAPSILRGGLRGVSRARYNLDI